MTSITALAGELQKKTAWQKTPEILDIDDYKEMIIEGIKTLYIDTGRAASYSLDIDKDDIDLPIDEEKYVLIVSQIGFFQRVQTDVNNIVGYTTDVLTVTSADKPYAHLQDTIEKLDKERRIVFYKMSRYCMLD